MIPVFTGRKARLPVARPRTRLPSPRPSRAGAAVRLALGAPAGACRVDRPCPSLLTSRTTTAWIGTASTFSLRRGRDVGGGVQARAQRRRRVLERDRDLEVLRLVARCWSSAGRGGRGRAARDGGGADLGHLALDLRRPSSASTRTSAAWPSVHVADVGLVHHDLDLHDRQVGHGHDHGGREALGADHDLALLLRQAGDDAVHGRDDGRLLEVVAGAGSSIGLLLGDAALLRRRPLACLHLELGVRLVERLVGDELLVVHLLVALEGEPGDARGRPRRASSSARGGLHAGLATAACPPRSAWSRCGPAPGPASPRSPSLT